MDIGQWIAIGLSAVLGVWFGIGSFYNRRRGINTYKWLQSGLKRLGKVSEASWIGSSGSGARLAVGQADSPFRRVEVIFLLESREILPIWLFNRVRNKQDELVLKAGLRTSPSFEVEVAPANDREFKYFLAEERKGQYSISPASSGLVLAVKGSDDDLRLTKLKAFLENYGRAVKRISLQRKTPHLVLKINLPPLKNGSAEGFFEALKDWLS